MGLVVQVLGRRCGLGIVLCDHLDGLLGTGCRAKGGESDVGLTLGAKACAGGGYDSVIVEQLFKKRGAIQVGGGLQPKVGGVFPAHKDGLGGL